MGEIFLNFNGFTSSGRSFSEKMVSISLHQYCLIVLHFNSNPIIMASHSVAIAKASLAAGMIRPDPTSISKPEIARFHTLLEAVLEQCSSANIQV